MEVEKVEEIGVDMQWVDWAVSIEEEENGGRRMQWTMIISYTSAWENIPTQTVKWNVIKYSGTPLENKKVVKMKKNMEQQYKNDNSIDHASKIYILTI